MKKIINTLKADRMVYLCSLFGGIFLILCALLTIVAFFKLPPVIPLFNQLPWGEARLAPYYFFGIPLILGIIVYIVDAVLLEKIYVKIPLLARIVGITMLLTSLFILLLYIRTLQIMW